MSELSPTIYSDEEFVQRFKSYFCEADAFAPRELSEKNLPRSSPLWEFAAACSVFSRSFQGSLDALHNKASELGLHEESDDDQRYS